MQIKIEKQTSNDYIQLTPSNRERRSDYFLYENFLPKYPNSFIHTKLKKNNIFPLYNNNIANKNLLKVSSN